MGVLIRLLRSNRPSASLRNRNPPRCVEENCAGEKRVGSNREEPLAECSRDLDRAAEGLAVREMSGHKKNIFYGGLCLIAALGIVGILGFLIHASSSKEDSVPRKTYDIENPKPRTPSETPKRRISESSLNAESSQPLQEIVVESTSPPEIQEQSESSSTNQDEQSSNTESLEKEAGQDKAMDGKFVKNCGMPKSMGNDNFDEELGLGDMFDVGVQE